MCKLMSTQDVVYQVLITCFIGDAFVMISQIRFSVNLCVQMTLVAKGMSCLKIIQIIAILLQLHHVLLVAVVLIVKKILGHLIRMQSVALMTPDGMEDVGLKQVHYCMTTYFYNYNNY